MPPEIFDVQAALKEHPESEVAAYLAQQHGIDRDAYLKEGHTDADFLAEYGSRPLPGATVASAEKTGKQELTPEEIDAQYNPVAGGTAGAIAGGAGIGAKKLMKINKAIDTLGSAAEKIVPTEDYVAPGQKWSAKTGYGSGLGETVEDVVEARKKENAPIGRGKVSKNIKGPLGIDAAMEDIAVKEAEQQRLAKIRAQDKLIAEAKQKGLAQETKFAPITKPASVLPLAGASIGYNLADVARHAKKDEYGQAGVSTVGALGAAAPLVKKLPPKARAVGALMGIGAPVVNAITGTVQEKADGGAIKGGLEAAKKLFVPKPTKIVRASEALGPHEGKRLGLTQTDNFGVHGTRMGGNQFPNFQNISPKHAEDRVVWMNDTENHANAMARNSKFGDQDVIWSTYIGAPDQLKSNKTVFNDILENHYNRELTPEQVDLINSRIATWRKGKDQKLVFPQPFDIRDKFAVQELAGDTFDRRAALASILGQGEGVKGTKAGIALPNYEDILRSHRDPLTEGVPTSSVGTRLFSVDPTPSKFSKDYHPDYEWTVHGEDMGVQFSPVPQNVMVPDWYAKTEAKSPGKNRTHGNAWFSYMKDPQQITHDYLMNLEKSGFADGGVVGYAGGKKVIEAGLKALEPEQTVKAYKLFRTDPKAPESLFPLFVNANKPVPIGQWLPAEAGELTAAGKVKSKIGDLAYRPGWHAGDMPIATHIGGKSSPDLTAPDFRPSNQVWAEVEMPADVDWQSIAMERAQRNKAGDIIPRTAHITDTIPEGGHYRYKTNPNMTGDWLIGGSMKVNRVLTPEEVMAINEAKGVADLPRFEPLPKKAKGGSTTPAWQRKEGKNPEGGLNAIGRASYNRETGGNLKAPQPEGGPRKKSFCARMEGMKKKNTSAATANDPDSRINKSLRKWKC